jgi:hypothetical protein
MESLKNRQLQFLAGEIKQESNQRRSIADVALRQAVRDTASSAYQKAVDPNHKSVGRNVPKSRLLFDALNLLKESQQPLTLDQVLIKLDVDVQTPHREDLNVYLRANAYVQFENAKFRYRVRATIARTSVSAVTSQRL